MSRYLLTLCVTITWVVHTNAFPTTLFCGELLHLSLAVVDLLSDANLLLSMQETQLEYIHNQQQVKETKMTSKEYIFDECLPAPLTSEWETNMDTYCQCNEFNVSCDNNSTELFVEENSLIENLTAINIDINIINTSDLLTEYIAIAETYISCKPHLWALEYEFKAAFAFTNWTCHECECIGNEYDKTNSILLLKAFYEYESLNSYKMQYCDPNKLLIDTYNDDLNKILIVCWTFLISGSIIQCVAICCRCVAAFQIALIELDEDDDEDKVRVKVQKLEYSFLFDTAKFGVGFMVSLLEDVPQTIIAMYYLRFLYADNGYYCHESFAHSPVLQRMAINPQDSITIILLANLNIAFAVATSVLMIVFKGIRNGFNLQNRMRNKYYIGNDKKLICIGVIVILFGTIIYVLSLLMPIAAVAYYGIAPSFHKQWMPAFIVFIAGCVSWGIIFSSCCIAFVYL